MQPLSASDFGAFPATATAGAAAATTTPTELMESMLDFAVLRDAAAGAPSDAAPPPDFRADALYREAVDLSAAAARRDEDLARERLAALAAGLRAAQDSLLAELERRAQQLVPQAAAEGKRSADVLAFKGADMYASGEEQFCYLYLVCGPRERAHRDELRAMGVEPLLSRLRREFRPFDVRHAWNPATNDNAVTLSW